MKTYRLLWNNNTSWRWTRNLSEFRSLIDSGGKFRMQVDFDGSSYEWFSDNTVGGKIAVDGTSYVGVFTAPLSDLARKTGVASMDCRVEMPNGAVYQAFGGSVSVQDGVTVASGDVSSSGVSGIPDTVIVAGEKDPTLPVPLPVSLTDAIATVQAVEERALAALAAVTGQNPTVRLVDAFSQDLAWVNETQIDPWLIQINDAFGVTLGYGQ